MITQLQIKNYRSLENIRINLERLTVLVGANGSGKSNLLDALCFVSDALRLGLDIAVNRRGGIDNLARWSKDKSYDIEIILTIENDIIQAEYSFVLENKGSNDYEVGKEKCVIHKLEDKEAKFETHDGEWISNPLNSSPIIQPRALNLPLVTGIEPFSELYNFLTGMSFYNIMPTVLREPQQAATPYPLDKQGRNLGSLLLEMERTGRWQYRRAIEDALRRIDAITGYQVNKIGEYLVIQLDYGEEKIRQAKTKKQPLFELFQESDGILRMLGILAALYQEPPRTLIGIEEPELNIHPGVMGLLWEELITVAEKSQIILTTHSPDLLDMCDAEQLRVVEKIDRITYIGPIEEEQKEIIRQKLFAPGELLQAQGLYRAEVNR